MVNSKKSELSVLNLSATPFRSKNFRLYTFGFFIFMFAFQMTEVALGWEIYERTHSAAMLGLVGLTQIMPVFVFTLPAGHFADRFNRKQIMYVTLGLLGCAGLVWAYLSTFQGPVYGFYIGILCAGISRAFLGPVRQSIVGRLVPASQMSRAIGWISASMNLAITLGPMTGGFLVAALKLYAPIYIFLSLACIAFALCIFGLSDDLAYAAVSSETKKNPAQKVSDQLLEGFRFVLKTKLMLSAVTLDLFAVLFGGATALLPIFAKDILNVGAMGLGWLRAAPALGAITMAIFLAYVPDRFSPLKNSGRNLLFAVFGFALATIGFGLSKHFALSFACLYLVGFFDEVSVVIRMTLVQLMTPDRMRGRVSAVNSMFIGASNELGAFESGMMAAAFGPAFSVIFGGVASLCIVGFVAWFWPELRKLKHLKDLETST